MTATLPADFLVRVAGGLAALLLATPRRTVPVGFFRTHCHIALAGFVAAALLDGPAADRLVRAGLVAGAALSFLAAIAWGLGLPRLGVPLAGAIAATAAGLLVGLSIGPAPGPSALSAASRLASAFLLGSTLTAMLLGHYYLTSPAMSIEPLRRFVGAMAVALGLRAAISAGGLALWMAGRGPVSAVLGGSDGLFLAMRWGMGVLGPALATALAWQTVAIRSTQSATGILYIAATLVLLGELTAMNLARATGLPL